MVSQNDGEATGEREAELDWNALLAQMAQWPDEEGWVTLDEAMRVAGIARSTLRSWYRSGKIAARMIPGPNGPQRVVRLDEVVEQALRSSRARRQLERARSLEAEVEELRIRLEALERRLASEPTRSERPPPSRPL